MSLHFPFFRILPAAVALGFAVLSPGPALAKRAAPPVVQAVEHNGVRYDAPNDDGCRGYVRAIDVKSGKTLWERTLFKVAIDPLLEKDVQHVFIRKMWIAGDKLVVEDEAKRTFTIEPAKPADKPRL